VLEAARAVLGALSSQEMAMVVGGTADRIYS
jgi:hypothetical protein